MPHSNIDPTTRTRAKILRRELTRAEQAMWSMLRDLRPYGGRFRRETPIGPYIADFAWLSAHLVIEVDGDSHETTAGKAHDQVRNAFMAKHGYRVLRFDNDQVIDGPDHVFLEIVRHVRHLLKGFDDAG
jgi:very-short-patch-repair endonuclease